MRVLACYAAPVEGAALAAPPEAQVPKRADLDVTWLCTGVGAPAATLSLARALAPNHDVDLVFNFGVGGAYPARHLETEAAAHPLAVGDLVWVGEDGFADLGVELPTGFRSLGEMGLGFEARFVADAEWTRRLAAATRARVEAGCTVARGAGTEALSAELARRTGARVETMEGAALAMVADACGVPFVQLRSISNFTGDRARGGWDLERACSRLHEGVLAALQCLGADAQAD